MGIYVNNKEIFEHLYEKKIEKYQKKEILLREIIFLLADSLPDSDYKSFKAALNKGLYDECLDYLKGLKGAE